MALRTRSKKRKAPKNPPPLIATQVRLLECPGCHFPNVISHVFLATMTEQKLSCGRKDPCGWEGQTVTGDKLDKRFH